MLWTFNKSLFRTRHWYSSKLVEHNSSGGTVLVVLVFSENKGKIQFAFKGETRFKIAEEWQANTFQMKLLLTSVKALELLLN